VVLKSIDVAKQTTTTTGLGVIVRCGFKGRKVAEGLKDLMNLIFDEMMPNWNCVAVPNSG
jgi:hypothetical protein